MQNEIDNEKEHQKIYSRYVILLAAEIGLIAVIAALFVWSYCNNPPKTREEFEENLRKGKELQRRMKKYSLPVDSFQCEIA